MSQTLIVTFPLVIFLMLNPTVGIISSLNWPDCKTNKNVLKSISHLENHTNAYDPVEINNCVTGIHHSLDIYVHTKQNSVITI
jgi:hypothetical protein